MTRALEIHDLAETGQLQLVCRSEDQVRPAPSVDFRNPVDRTDLQEIEWYFREYLDNPFGLAKTRAEAITTGLANLGRSLYETVFNSGVEARNICSTAKSEGFGEYQLMVISQRAEFLSLPWELLNQPELGYLVTEMASVVRRRTPDPMPSFMDQLPTDQLNVLMISPRLDSDSFFGSLATETARALDALDIQVELDYITPPTIGALGNYLSDRAGHYHLIHLDGITIDAASAQLLLEAAGHSSESVPASRIAGLLNRAQIPVALLTGGSSATSDSLAQWPKAVAGLCDNGIPVVVALNFPLPDSSSREKFLQQFYQSLARGTDVAASVAAARKALMDAPNRLTLAGKQVFWDWITPVVYQSQHYVPPVFEVDKPDPLAAPVIQPQEQAVPELQLPAAGQFGLVGRQRELGRLERLLEKSPTLLLTGNTGTGKTELALGLARWFLRIGRGQRPGGVFYTTFEASHPSGLERIVHEIGTTVIGLDFADMNFDQQRQWVVEHLQQRPSLLIWDNLENAAGFPSGSPGLLEVPEQAELNAFLSEVTRDGQSWALLVSRRQHEGWLSLPHITEESGGLEGHDRRELAAQILDQSGVDPSRVGPELLVLLDLIQGHPLAMQIALPLLKDVPIAVLLAELQKTLADLPETSREEGRDPYLTALMEYSWGRMSRRSRTHLPFLSMFQRRVMLDILNHITGEPVYRTVMGEELGWGACRTLLRSAQAAGFLELVSPSVYQIHPALPWFYGRKLAQQVPAARVGQLEQEYVRVYADTADYFMESLYENQDSGVTAILAEEGNLTQALGLALESGQWDNAQLLIQPLAQVYRMQKRFVELRRLRRQILETVGQTAAVAAGKGAADLWLYLLGTEANEAVDRRELRYAENLNQQLHDYLTSQEGGDLDPRTAAVYHQFGLIALHRWQLDQAAGWFQKSLAIIEPGEDDRASVADDYFALGQVKQYQRYYSEAREWYQKALDIHQRLPDDEEMVKDYRALGAVSLLKFEYQEAESWYQRARAAVEELRDEETAVLIFHELGTVSHSQYLFDEAISWYEQALNLSDRLGLHEQMAVEFHHLGLLHQARGIVYEDAEDWFMTALEQWDRVGNRRAAGDECRQLGVLFHEQKRYTDAEKWYHQAREVFEA
ncbi:MAG TPA: tetratricopeptide repeat protein, partial [Dehalococcoidia bacterium]|nr:tetratricopeptide repeat protein [Dehalococcoidia bacterium]